MIHKEQIVKQGEFLRDIIPGHNHRPLLWMALEMTHGSIYPVGEFGAGGGSTPFIRKYCEDAKRVFLTYDSNSEWAQQWGAEVVENWNQDNIYRNYSVVLIDQAPGEFRHSSMVRLKDSAEIIVVHDAEPDESMGYLLETIWHHFKYRVYTKKDKIWTAAVSNHIDLHTHAGRLIGDYKVEL